MKTADITPIIEKIRQRVEAHRLAPGSYARFLRQNEKGTREMGESPYGCADAANILYTIGAFPTHTQQDERNAFVTTLQKMQQPDGLFYEKTHHPFHATAHCAAALELFDASPLYPCTAQQEYLDTANLYKLLEGLDWANNPWDGSHIGAGIYVSLNLTGAADQAWNKAYFDWFWENADPETGFWTGNLPKEQQKAPLFYYMAGAFHFLFNHEYAHMPLRYPEKVIDSCLTMYNDGGLPSVFGTYSNFLEVDWLFCLTRAARQTAHRFDEVQSTLEHFYEHYLKFWNNADWETEESLNDMHMLLGGVCTLAELQNALRGRLWSDKPLKSVLDRRPFI